MADWGTQFGMPSHSHAPLVIEGGFGVRENTYGPVSAFRNYGSLGSLHGYGYTDEPAQAEPGSAAGGLTGEQIFGIAQASETFVGIAGDAMRRRKESMKGLIRQRINLKKKISRTKDGWRKQRYKRELEHVNYQIESLKAMLAEDSYLDGGGLPWGLIIGTVLIGGAVLFGVTRAGRKRE